MAKTFSIRVGEALSVSPMCSFSVVAQIGKMIGNPTLDYYKMVKLALRSYSLKSSGKDLFSKAQHFYPELSYRIYTIFITARHECMETSRMNRFMDVYKGKAELTLTTLENFVICPLMLHGIVQKHGRSIGDDTIAELSLQLMKGNTDVMLISQLAFMEDVYWINFKNNLFNEKMAKILESKPVYLNEPWNTQMFAQIIRHFSSIRYMASRLVHTAKLAELAGFFKQYWVIYELMGNRNEREAAELCHHVQTLVDEGDVITWASLIAFVDFLLYVSRAYILPTEEFHTPGMECLAFILKMCMERLSQNNCPALPLLANSGLYYALQLHFFFNLDQNTVASVIHSLQHTVRDSYSLAVIIKFLSQKEPFENVKGLFEDPKTLNMMKTLLGKEYPRSMGRKPLKETKALQLIADVYERHYMHLTESNGPLNLQISEEHLTTLPTNQLRKAFSALAYIFNNMHFEFTAEYQTWIIFDHFTPRKKLAVLQDMWDSWTSRYSLSKVTLSLLVASNRTTSGRQDPRDTA